MEADRRDDCGCSRDGAVPFEALPDPALADAALHDPRPGAVSAPAEGRVRACDVFRRAVALLRGGRSDEAVEDATGVSLTDILFLRARLATTVRQAPERDRSRGRSA